VLLAAAGATVADGTAAAEDEEAPPGPVIRGPAADVRVPEEEDSTEIAGRHYCLQEQGHLYHCHLTNTALERAGPCTHA
jgi:hypothetical protein